MNFWNNFAEKHPGAAQWIREGGLFIIFSYVVTFAKYLMLQFLPSLFSAYANVGWTWPGIPVELFGVSFDLAVVGNSVAAGGLAFTLANYTAILLGECINFPLQRNVTFKSHGPLPPQILLHLVGTIAVMLVMNLFTCIWNPLASHFGVPDFLFNIVTTVVTGGVSMIIIFAVDKTVFAPDFGERKNAK